MMREGNKREILKNLKVRGWSLSHVAPVAMLYCFIIYMNLNDSVHGAVSGSD